MVSILEQYEIESDKIEENYSNTRNELGLHYSQTPLNQDESGQIFQRVALKNIFSKAIKQFDYCGDVMVILDEHKKLNSLNTTNDTLEYIDTTEAISKFYLDPSGKYLFMSTYTNEFLYYQRTQKKFKTLSKLKGHRITAIAWNKHYTRSTYDCMLLGTQRGLIFEILLINDNLLESSCKQIYSIGKDETITGIQIFNAMYDYSASEEFFDIIVSTSNRLYEFMGIMNMKNLNDQTLRFNQFFMNNYESKCENELGNYIEMPGNMNFSQLKLFTKRNKRAFIGWLTGGGIFICDLDLSALQRVLQSNFRRLLTETNGKIINYVHGRDSDHSDDHTPIDFCLTEFHVLVMFTKKIQIYCIMSEELIYTEKINDLGKFTSFWSNQAQAAIGFYTSKSAFKYEIVKETRNLWRFHLKNEEFEKAKDYCKDNVYLLNEILTKQAENLFSKKRYQESAEVYASTDNSFEEICLKFLDINDTKALRVYLMKRISLLKPSADITQMTVLVAWTIEIFLNQLSDALDKSILDEYQELHEEFHLFLDNHKTKECLRESKEAIYDIFTNHGNMDDLVYFAELMKDYEKIISYFIQQENYYKALEALSKSTSPESYYKYSPILMQYVYKELIQLIIKQGSKLDPKRLLPALSVDRQSEEQGLETISYLEFCLNSLSTKEIAIYNYLLSLYVKYQPKKLLAFVKHEGSMYNKDFASRLCLQFSDNLFAKEACVYIYRSLGLYEEAIDLALEINTDLAINLTKDDMIDELADELKQKLWLKIARHVIEYEKDVSKAMCFLDECDNMLKIEDILPYFPEFVTIDNFKDSIRDSLALYMNNIDTLKRDIDEAAKSADSIRGEIKSIKSRSVSTTMSDRCLLCKYQLLTRRFYIFPCAHKFHSDCLYQAQAPFMSASKRHRIDELLKMLNEIIYPTSVPSSGSTLPATQSTNTLSNFTEALNQRFFHKLQQSKQSLVSTTPIYNEEEINRIKHELDDLLASECVYCGEFMIKRIDEPFFNSNEYQRVFDSWL